MAGDDLAKGATEASATGVFRTIGKEPAKEIVEKPVAVRTPAAAPPAASPVPATHASSGGFTQLLRALNYDAVKDAVKEVPPTAPVETKVPSSGLGGPMTQLLRTLSASPVEGSATEKPVVSPSSSQVTSFLPQSAPVAHAAVPPMVAEPAGSFTQLFERTEAKPLEEIELEKREAAGAPSLTQRMAQPEPVAAPLGQTEPKPTPPVSFTQLFAGVGADVAPTGEAAPGEDTGEAPGMSAASAVEAATPKVDVPAAPVTTPGSFTQMFQTLSASEAEPVRRETAPVIREAEGVPVEKQAPVSAAANAPVSFTQMFQALDGPSAEPVRTEDVPVRAAASAPGSFTQVFEAVETAPVEEARYVAAPVAETPKQGGAAGAGSFTQMFRTLDEPKLQEPAAGTKPGAGSFTQLFGSVAPSSAPAVPAASPSSERSFAANAPEHGESGASQIFAMYKEPPAVPVEQRGPVFSPVEPGPMERLPASTPARGGLTQLLRALDGPTPAPKPYVAPSYAPEAPASQPGSFTGVYGELGAPVAPVAPVAAPPVAASAAPAGPSEFTRLINASALREAGLRGGGTAAGAPVTTPANAPAAGGGFAMPGGMPAMPHASFGSPAAPSASLSGPGGAHASLSAAGGGHASLAAPHLPSVSTAAAVKLPELAKAGSAPAGIQKYVPLLLILVIFLLLAILAAVVVLMKK